MIFGIAFGVSEGDISVAATFLLAVVGFMILYYISRPMSRYRIAVLIVSIIAFILSAYYLHWWFGVRTVSKKCMMLFIIFVAATEPCMRYLTKFFGFVERKFLKEVR
jgi:cation-transporting ATPase E